MAPRILDNEGAVSIEARHGCVVRGAAPATGPTVIQSEPEYIERATGHAHGAADTADGDGGPVPR